MFKCKKVKFLLSVLILVIACYSCGMDLGGINSRWIEPDHISCRGCGKFHDLMGVIGFDELIELLNGAAVSSNSNKIKCAKGILKAEFDRALANQSSLSFMDLCTLHAKGLMSGGHGLSTEGKVLYKSILPEVFTEKLRVLSYVQMEVLLKAGVNPNTQNWCFQHTPLHLLAKSHKCFTTKLQQLLRYGANCSMRNWIHETAYDLACEQENYDLAVLLKKAQEQQYNIMKRKESLRIARLLMLAYHLRCGAKSPLQILPHQLISEICSHVEPEHYDNDPSCIVPLENADKLQ